MNLIEPLFIKECDEHRLTEQERHECADFLESFFAEGRRNLELPAANNSKILDPSVEQIAKSYIKKSNNKTKLYRVDIEEDGLTEDCFECGAGIDSQSQLQGMSTCKNCREKKEC